VTQPGLRLDALASGYGSAMVLRGVSHAVPPGGATALLGKNGMGKSTLLKTVMGYLRKQRGSVCLGERDLGRLAPPEVARMAVAYAPQEQALFTELSVRDNLRMGLRQDRWFDARFAHVAELFPVFKDRLKQPAGTLSGGEQKMLLVARALMMQPALLLLDEITEGVQPTVVERIAQALLRERRQRGTTMLLVEQNVPFALQVADDYVVLERGEIVDRGAANDSGATDAIFEHLRV
jgi:urea transport system ATP-binding protein